MFAQSRIGPYKKRANQAMMRVLSHRVKNDLREDGVKMRRHRESMMDIRRGIVWMISSFLALACSENFDEINAGDTPVLKRDPVVHVPGGNDAAIVEPEEPDDPEEPGDSGDKGKEEVKDPTEITYNTYADGDENGNEGGTEGGSNDRPAQPNLPEKDPAIPDDAPVENEVDGVAVLPMTYAAYTTLQRTHRPKIGTHIYSAERVKELIAAWDFKATDKDKYEKYGLGAEVTDGEPWIIREKLLKASDPSLSRKGKSLAYFWQVSDPQIIDVESPCRMEGVVVSPYVVSSAYRPQGIFSKHMFDLHVQTARRISDYSSRPFDFVLVTGDIADNAQENEFGWFDVMMGGGVLDPDTGADDDPVPGPGNDFTDPFYSPGIGDIPWYVAIGNHDLLYMGFTVATDKMRAACVGDEVVDLFSEFPVASAPNRTGYNNGYQDVSTVNATVVTSGKTPADPHRRMLNKSEALQHFYDAPGLPKGHGLDPETMAKGWGYYTAYPIPGKPIKLISLDTNSGTFSEANMTPEQFTWLKGELESARKAHELVILQSHHGTGQMAGTVTQSKFQALVASYPNVILHITGHGHANDSNVYIDNNGGYWEVMLASVVDFPSQTRVFEIVHEGDGLIAIYITNLEPNAPEGTFVDTALNYAAARKFFGMSKDPIAEWEAEKAHRNLILRTRVPKDVYENLDRYEWSDVVESEDLLKNLEFVSSDKK